MAMRSVSRIWLRHWVEQQLRGSRAAHAYLERPQRLIIARERHRGARAGAQRRIDRHRLRPPAAAARRGARGLRRGAVVLGSSCRARSHAGSLPASRRSCRRSSKRRRSSRARSSPRAAGAAGHSGGAKGGEELPTATRSRICCARESSRASASARRWRSSPASCRSARSSCATS